MLGILLLVLQQADFSLAFQNRGSNCNIMINDEDDFNKIALVTSSSGDSEHGNKSAIIDAVLNGAELQVAIPDWNYATRTQQVSVVNNGSEVCAQAVFHVSKDSWKTFNPNAYWYFLLICTTGHIEKYLWYVGPQSPAPIGTPSQTTYQLRIGWMFRFARDGPVYCNTDKGLPTCGSIQDLRDVIKNGADISVVNQQVSPFSFVMVDPKQQMVSGLHSWSVSTRDISDHQSFKADESWRFTTYSTSGLLDISRWNIGPRQNTTNYSLHETMKWFANTCWYLAYQHDGNGNPLDGSLPFLRSAILIGHRVKLVINDNSNLASMEISNLVLRSSDISAQFSDQRSDNLSNFLVSIHLSTTGQRETLLYDVGSSSNGSSFTTSVRASWYIDSRHWKHMLTTSETGLATFGSKSDMISNFLRYGSQLRCVIHFSADHILVAEADNVELSPDGTNFGAQILRIIRYTTHGTSSRHFENVPSWKFIIATTEGTISQSEWMVGDHTTRVTNTSTATIDWFVG